MGKSWSGKLEIRNAKKVFVGKVTVNAHLGDQTENESIIFRWTFKKCDGVKYICTFQWPMVVIRGINIWAS